MLGSVVEICPQCSSSVKTSVSRLIQDSCGHKKCRLCLLKEETGCVLCAANSKEESGNEQTQVNLESNNNNGEEKSDNKRSSQKARRKSQTASSEKSKIKEDPQKNEPKVPKKKTISFESHITIVPGNPVKYYCSVCNKSCSRMSALYHNYCASKSKPFTCEVCNRGFITKTHFDYHTRVHTGILPFKCPVCNKGFKQKGKLTRHMNLHSGNRQYVCQECGRSFYTPDSLKSHQRTHSGEKANICPECSKAFSEPSNLRKHMAIHQDIYPFMCDGCGKRFKMEKYLEDHQQTVHSRERKHICKECNRKFAMKRDLKRHSIVHTAVKPHCCTVCGLAFRRKDNFDRHMKNTHPEIFGARKSKLAPSTNQNPRPIQDSKNDDTARNKEPEQTATIVTPIPPSQTIDASILHSVMPMPHSSDIAVSVGSKIVKAPKTINSVPNISVEPSLGLNKEIPASTSTYTSSTSSNMRTISNSVEIPHLPVANNDPPNLSIPTAAIDTSNPAHSIPSHPASSSIPPKKKVEYYRAVPVINRLGSASNSKSASKTQTSHVTETASESGKRAEAKNCVPTITRASEGFTGSVITRNTQQRVVKPGPKLECYRILDVFPTVQTNQTALRNMLNDVDCSNQNSEVLNLTSDAALNRSDSQTNTNVRYVEHENFNRSSTCGAQFYPPKLPGSYSTQTYSQNELSETSTSTEYASHEYSKVITSEGLPLEGHFRSNNGHSVNYENLIKPSYPGDVVCNLPQQYSESSKVDTSTLNKSDYEAYNFKHINSGGRIKFVADVAGSKECPTNISAIGQPVIVGGRKSINNVICTKGCNLSQESH